MSNFIYNDAKKYLIKESEYSDFILPKIGEYLSVQASTFSFKSYNEPISKWKRLGMIIYDFISGIDTLFDETKWIIEGRVKDIQHKQEEFNSETLIILDVPIIIRMV